MNNVSQCASDGPSPKLSGKARLYPWYVVSLLSLAYLFSFVDRVILSLLIVPIQQDLQIGDFQVSLIVGMGFALFYTLFGLPIGRLVDIGSRRLIIMTGIIIWSLATAACGFADGFWFLFTARILVAAGEATLSPSAYSLITDYFPPSRLSFAMSIYGMGVFIGAGAALILAGFVISAVISHPHLSLPWLGEMRSWQLVFLAVGLPGLPIAALILTIAEPPRRGMLKAVVSGTSKQEVRKAIPIREVVAFMKLNRRTFTGLIGAFSLSSLFGYGLNAWAPTFLIRSYGWTLPEVGLIYGSIVLVSGLLGVTLGGLTGDWLQKRGAVDAKLRVAAFGYALMLPCAVAAPLMTSAPWALTFLALANFGFSFPAACGIAAMQSITPNQMRGQVSVFYLLILNIVGLGFGPSLIAAITEYGFGDKMALGYSLSIVAAIVLPPAVGLLLWGMKYYRQSLVRAEAWSDQ